MADRAQRERFERLVLPHLDAAYALARWLTRNEHDAEDVVQEAYLRAYRYFTGFRGENHRAWLLAIVRNTCLSWLERNRSQTPAEAAEALRATGGGTVDPETALAAASEGALAMRLIAELPPEFREVIVLRELEDLSYREVAEIIGVPEGTVMSRLARARARLRQLWRERTQ